MGNSGSSETDSSFSDMDGIESPPNTYFAASMDYYYYQSPKTEQIDWLKEWHKAKTSINEAIQREIYLMEEIHLIKKEVKTPSDSESETMPDTVSESELFHVDSKQKPTTTNTLDDLRNELDRARQAIYIRDQALHRLYVNQPIGWYIGNYFEDADCEDSWCDEVNTSCIIRRGCCARECGCCERPRQTKVGPKSQRGGKWTHCTESCGCCIRWRGFYKTDPSLEEKEKESGRS